MSLSKVENVDVVSYAAAVRSIIVISEKHKFVAFAADSLQDDGDEVAFGTVIFTVVFSCTCGVEVTQSGIFDSVNLAVPLEDFLEAELGFSVWVDRDLTVVFADRNSLRLSEGGGGAGEHEALSTSGNGGVREVDRIGEVVAEPVHVPDPSEEVVVFTGLVPDVGDVRVRGGKAEPLTLYCENLNDKEKQIILNGCLMNYYAANAGED